jgi:hypothetical protein
VLTLSGEGKITSSTFRGDSERLSREMLLVGGSTDRTRQERPGDRHLDSLLSDPVTRLVMSSDAVSEADLRGIMTKARAHTTVSSLDAPERRLARRAWPTRRLAAGSGREFSDSLAVERGENEGIALGPA